MSLLYQSLCLIILMRNAIASLDSLELPEFLKVCHRNDPNLNECLMEAMEEIRPQLLAGIPELNIPVCEPLMVPEIKLLQGNGPMAFQSYYKDVHLWGTTNYSLNHLDIDQNNNSVYIEMSIPRILFKSNYIIDGKIMMIPIKGEGMCYGNYTDVNANITMQLENIKIQGEEHLHCEDVLIEFRIGSAEVRLDDLFDGNKDLGNAMNAFINANWEMVAEEIKPVLEDVIADLFQTFANGIFAKYPTMILFPE